MDVQRITFGANYSKTPNGNYYKKKNTGKRIATMAGIAGGVALSTVPAVQSMAMNLAVKMFPKNPMKMFAATYGILGLGIGTIAIAARAIGAIPDNVVNKKRIAKADHIA